MSDDSDYYEDVMTQAWDYRQCSDGWQIYISKGLWHIAQVKKESVARLIIFLANQNRAAVKHILANLKSIDN